MMACPGAADDLDWDALGEAVRDGGPDWTVAWERLCEGLVPLLERKLAAEGLAGDALDEAVGETCLVWQQAAAEGKLLRHWQREAAPVVHYLTARFTRLAARRAVRKLTGDHMGGEDGERAMDAGARPQRTRIGTVPAPCAPIVFRTLGQQGVTRPHLVAGMQLLPHIDWSAGTGPVVEAEMPSFVVEVDGDWRTPVSARREACIRDLEGRLDAAYERLDNDGRGVTPRQEQALAQRITKLQFQLWWRPLDARALMALTGQGRAAVDQYQRRYKVQLAELVSGVPGHVAVERAGEVRA